MQILQQYCPTVAHHLKHIRCQPATAYTDHHRRGAEGQQARSRCAAAEDCHPHQLREPTIMEREVLDIMQVAISQWSAASASLSPMEEQTVLGSPGTPTVLGASDKPNPRQVQKRISQPRSGVRQSAIRIFNTCTREHRHDIWCGGSGLSWFCQTCCPVLHRLEAWLTHPPL